MMIKPFDEINKQHRKKILKNLESNTITFKENDNILSSFKNSKLIGIIQKGSISIIREDYNGNIIVLDKINQYELFIEELCILSSDDKVIANTDTVISFFDYDLLINNKKLKCHDYYNQFVLNILQIVMEITKNNKTHDDPLARKLRYLLKKEEVDLSQVDVIFSSSKVEQTDVNFVSSIMPSPSCAGLSAVAYIIKKL